MLQAAPTSRHPSTITAATAKQKLFIANLQFSKTFGSSSKLVKKRCLLLPPKYTMVMLICILRVRVRGLEEEEGGGGEKEK